MRYALKDIEGIFLTLIYIMEYAKIYKHFRP